MKELGLICLFIMGLNFTSCATKKPPVWYDKYGIMHREEVEPDEIKYVKIVMSTRNLGGCMRLRNIYLEGTSFKDYALQEHGAKMGATHVYKMYYNNLEDTMGIAYDCNGKHKRNTVERLQKMNYMNALISESERRTYEKGNNKVKTGNLIPTFDE